MEWLTPFLIGIDVGLIVTGAGFLLMQKLLHKNIQWYYNDITTQYLKLGAAQREWKIVQELASKPDDQPRKNYTIN